jgi:hypothetical protein
MLYHDSTKLKFLFDNDKGLLTRDVGRPSHNPLYLCGTITVASQFDQHIDKSALALA